MSYLDAKWRYYARRRASGFPIDGLVFHALLSSKSPAETGQTVTYGSNAYADTYKGIGCMTLAAYGTGNVVSFSTDAFSGDATYSVWFCARDTAARGFSLLTLGGVNILTCNRPNLFLRGSSVASGISKDSWHNAILTSGGGTLTAYLDGALAGTVAYTLSGTAVGMKNVTSSSYVHSWANCRIYDRVLSLLEIRELAAELTPTA